MYSQLVICIVLKYKQISLIGTGFNILNMISTARYLFTLGWLAVNIFLKEQQVATWSSVCSIVLLRMVLLVAFWSPRSIVK